MGEVERGEEEERGEWWVEEGTDGHEEEGETSVLQGLESGACRQSKLIGRLGERVEGEGLDALADEETREVEGAENDEEVRSGASSERLTG